jgi:hypothetical protein
MIAANVEITVASAISTVKIHSVGTVISREKM